MSLSLANGLSTILLPQAQKLLTGHAFWVARAQRHRPLPPQPWGGPLCLIGAQDPSPLLSLPARLDPPIDGRSPKFWGEAICNLAIQRPGAKQARHPGPVFSSFSSTPTHPRKFFLSPHSLLQLQAARCDDGDFFLQLLQVTGSGRGCCQSGNFFRSRLSYQPPARRCAGPLTAQCPPPDLDPVPKTPQDPSATTSSPNHDTSPPPSITLSIPRLRIALVSSAARVQCIFLLRVLHFVGVSVVLGVSVSARRPVARRTSVPHPVTRLSRLRFAPVASDLGLYATTSPPFTSFRLIRPTNNPSLLPLHPTDLPSHTRARARRRSALHSPPVPLALDDRDRRQAAHAITRRRGRRHPRRG